MNEKTHKGDPQPTCIEESKQMGRKNTGGSKKNLLLIDTNFIKGEELLHEDDII